MRIGRPLVFATRSGVRRALNASGLPYVVSSSDVERVLGRASDFSVYAVNDELVQGYLTKNGVRIGVVGEGVTDGEKLLTVKNVSALVIRVPHEIKGAADQVLHYAVQNGALKNLLVISPPGAGKTTMLRDLARQLSRDFSTLVIDERYELAAAENGIATLDVGECEVVSGVKKSVAYENCVRAMSPELIVTDELFSAREVDAICDVVRSGISVFASVHGGDVQSVRRSKVFAPLFDAFDVAVVLGKNPPGRIIGVEYV